MKKTVEQTYQVLDEITHVRQRTGMYAGSTELQTSNEWVYNPQTKRMEKQEISYVPALVKIFSEILDNAIDEHKRAPKVLDVIRVDFDESGEISVLDNGRGIPVEVHSQTGKYVAETVFSNLRSGSNFNDAEDQQTIGTNGVGSVLTNILSTSFKIESCDGKKSFSQVFSNGMRERGEPKIKPDTKNRTKIAFTPDYAFFKLQKLDGGNALRMAKKVVDAAACNPGVKFYINGDRIQIKDFGDYISLYDPEYVFDDTDDWKVGISHSDGFEQISFVNSVETYQGGTHVDYVTNQVVNAIRAFIEKKHKVEIKPADIRNHLRVFISANVNRPKFSSQTKENMISQPSSYKTSWSVPDGMIKKLIKSPIIQSVLDWVEAKTRATEMAELRRLNKDASKTKPKHVDKFDDAIEKVDRYKCVLALCEGDSARNSVQSARGKNQFVGSFSLRGKPLNVYEAELKDVLGNAEFANILTITGLQLGEPGMPEGRWMQLEIDGEDRVVNEFDTIILKNGKELIAKDLFKRQMTPDAKQLAEYWKYIGVKHRRNSNLRFGKILILSDFDTDGHHISALLISFFAKYWPELFDHGVIYRFDTPLYIAEAKQIEHEFFTKREYETWAEKNPKHKVTYYKGLGGFDTSDFERFINQMDEYLLKIKPLSHNDIDKINMVFASSQADDRKTWLSGINYFTDIDE